jgi:hypothetical protein
MTSVTGIVTTSLASIVVLREAVEAGANFVITCGPQRCRRRRWTRCMLVIPGSRSPSQPFPQPSHLVGQPPHLAMEAIEAPQQ